MFAFGGAVFGEDKAADVEREELDQKAMELAAKEALLMAELVAVRAEALAAGVAGGSESGPAVDARWNDASGGPPSTPGVSALDFMPVVTRRGVPALEVGLEPDDDEGSDDGTDNRASQQHMLPIFRLPTIDAGARFTRRAPTEKNLILEQRAREQAVEQRESMAKLLNMTTAELAALEGESIPAALTADASGATTLSTRRASGRGVGAKTSSFSTSSSARRRGGRGARGKGNSSSKRVSGGSRAARNGPARLFDRNSPRVLQSESNPTIDELRRALGTSLTSLVGMNQRVDQDIIEVQELCPITSIRAQMFMKRRGMGKLTTVMARVVAHRISAGFERWHSQVAALLMEERRHAFKRLQAANNLNAIMQGMLRGMMSKAMRAWVDSTTQARELESMALETEAAMRIQQAARGYLGRKKSALQKILWNQQKETRAASKLQARFRGHSYRGGQRRERATRKLQRWWRAVRNPEERQMAVMWRKQSLAARKVQAAARRRLARREVRRRRQYAIEVKSARRLQARFRGSAGRKEFHRARVRSVKDKAATNMQTRARGFLERKRVEKMRALAALNKRKMESAALKVQTKYRAHRGQLSFHLKMQAKRATQRVEGGAAAKLQARFRGRRDRAAVKDKRKGAQREMVRYARAWAEFFDEAENRYFYYNEFTEATEWEPPADGYRKLDGSLVLWNGKTITDPDAEEDDDADENEGDDEEEDSEEPVVTKASYDFDTNLGPYEHVYDQNAPDDGYATGEVSTGYESGYDTAAYGTDGTGGYDTAASGYDDQGYATAEGAGSGFGEGYDEYGQAYDATATAALDAWGNAAAAATVDETAYGEWAATEENAAYATDGEQYDAAASAWTEYFDEGAKMILSLLFLFTIRLLYAHTSARSLSLSLSLSLPLL